MRKHRTLLWIAITILLAAVVVPAPAANPPKEPAPGVGQKAGSISALLPVARIVRGAGRGAVTSEAKKGDELIWNDLVKTEKGGRARITLLDQSILSLGSQAELRVVRHDARSQQTALALGYGRLRAEVTKVSRQGGKFELRTPTAVAGVIGTDFGTESSVGGTTFLCISGVVQVSNVDPGVGGSVQCAAGMTTSVTPGKPPTIPTTATPEQIQQLMEDTEPALIGAMSPTSLLPGASADAIITGSQMAGVNSVSITGTGITASLAGTSTDTSVTVHLIVDPSAAAGPRTLTLSKQSGAASAAVFNIFSPPTTQLADSSDFKKTYHDFFDQLAGSAKAGLSAYVAGAQQAADLAAQLLQQANQGAGVDLTQATTTLNSHVTAVQKAVDEAAAQIDTAKSAADRTFDAQVQTAYNALLQRNPDGTPDEAFNQAVQATFNQVNATLGSNFNDIRGTLSGALQTATSNISQVQADWSANISAATQNLQPPPTPAVNNIERNIDLGAAFGAGAGTLAAIDAANSKASTGASITSYRWVLCDSSYKPAQFGVPIAANAPGCNPISGYVSSTSDFNFPTCNLNAGDYIARVTVTDSNNQSAAMDVKVHVLPPTYDDPATRLVNLGAAYTTLNISQFLSFFDETSFAGFTALQENVRNTFLQLSSMNINLRTSQASTSCNDATLRADWVLNYTYQQVCTPITGSTQLACTDPGIVYSQEEQLTVRMVRTPGKGWNITDFQGDNGKLQSVPAVANVDASAPDLQVIAAYPTGAGAGSSSALPLPPGPQEVTVTIANLGTASLSQQTTVDLHLIQDPSTEVATVTGVLVPSPLPAGNSVQVTANLPVPLLAAGTSMHLTATVDPACSISPAEQSCANNSFTQSLVIGAVNFQLALAQPISPVQNVLIGGSAQIPITLTESGTAFAIPISFSPANANLSYTVVSPMPPGTQSVTVSSAAAMTTGSFPLTITASSYGVTQSVMQALNFVSASIVPTNLLLNDPSNPLVIQMGQTSLTMLPSVRLKLESTFFTGSASVSASPTTMGFVSTVDNGATTTVGPGGSFTWQITANYGASTTVIPLTVTAQLPDSNPAAVVHYTLYVKAVGAPDLQIVSVYPGAGQRTPSVAEPWLAGEAINFEVVVKNVGGVRSAGNEPIAMKLGSYDVGSASVPSLAPTDPPYTVTVHAVAPDVGTSFNNSANTLKTKLHADTLGDLNYHDNICQGIGNCANGIATQTAVPTADWRVLVTGDGVDDNTALPIGPSGGNSTTVEFSCAARCSPAPGTSVTLVPGKLTTGVSFPTLASATLSAGTPYTVEVVGGLTLPAGYAYAQVIAEMKDGGTVTARRQATIHLYYLAAPTTPDVAVTIAPLNFVNQATPLQLNGPLAERFSVTPSCLTACNSAVDLTFNDAPNTITTPVQFNRAPFNVAQTATVVAAMDPNGEISWGPASGYQISATGATLAVAGRRGSTSPSPVGPPILLYVNVGDIELNATSGMSSTFCVNAVPGGSPVQVTASWDTMGSGFNAAIAWQVTPAGAPLIFGGNFSGSANGPPYPPISATIQATQTVEELLRYTVELTISNGISSATKYFPFHVDASSAQNLCGATLGARGYTSQRLRGTWSRSAISLGGPIALSGARKTAHSAGGALPDLKISASDVSFTPSMPKIGDPIQVRFRVRNEGNADAAGVPIALQINGTTVAIDTFDLAAGRTVLAGLQWNGVLPPRAATRMIRAAEPAPMSARRRALDPDRSTTPASSLGGPADRIPLVRAALVIDPQHTIQQKSTLEKSAPLAHFGLRSPDAVATGAAALAGSQRILLEMADGSCIGLRLTTGSAGPCGTSDVELNVDDKGGLSLNTFTGVADLGGSFGPASSSARLDAARLSGARYVSHSAALGGHSYAVQLSGGRTAVLTVASVRNPGELDARARALFRAAAIRVLGKLGGDTAGPRGPGEVAAAGTSRPTVFVELVLQTN